MRMVFGLLLIGAGGFLLYVALGGSNAVPTWLLLLLSGNTSGSSSSSTASKMPVGTG